MSFILYDSGELFFVWIFENLKIFLEKTLNLDDQEGGSIFLDPPKTEIDEIDSSTTGIGDFKPI